MSNTKYFVNKIKLFIVSITETVFTKHDYQPADRQIESSTPIPDFH